MVMQLFKTPAYSVKDAVRTAFTYTLFQPNLTYSVGYALPIFTGFYYNNTSVTKIDNQTVLLPAGSIYIVTITLILDNFSGTGDRVIIVRPYLNGVIYDNPSYYSNSLVPAVDKPGVSPCTKTYTIDCTDGVSRQLQFRCVQATTGVTTFNLDNWSNVHFIQLT